MGKREYIVKIKRSRKMYLLIYLMNLAIILFLVYLFYKEYTLNKKAIIISIIFIIVIIKITEIHRFRNWWAITEHSLIQSTGILNKNVREVDFSSISDIDLDQPLFKRMFDYGNVNVRLFLNETSINIENINKPESFMEKLQELIVKNKNKKHGLRKISPQ